ncbi:hypothetical protein [Zamilon virus]|uniref:Uncharacterized protein n=1 Tax=Zamilon virus TaxID=1411887 RepID=V6BPN4_9VIRU|nr:hypothetical protein X812_gp03 [Zamilon virus]AVL93349.1 hypothetical protein za3_9 [Zamilon virus]CDI70046.1 hypothetical protein [Zamilon virus]
MASKAKKIKRNAEEVLENIDDENFVSYDQLAMALEKAFITTREKILTVTELEEQLLIEKDLKNLMLSDIAKFKREANSYKKKLEIVAPKTNFRNIMVDEWDKTTEEQQQSVRNKYQSVRSGTFNDYYKYVENLSK